MGKPRCTGTECSKFVHQKKLVNQYQIAHGIDECILCVVCAKKLYDGFVGLVCLIADCMIAPQGGEYGPYCSRHSSLECSHADCTTAPQGGEYGPFCKNILVSSAHMPIARLLPEVESTDRFA